MPTPGGKPEPPIYLHESANTVSSENGLSQGWVDKLSKFTDDIPLADRLSFSAYFSNNIELIHMGITRRTLLPLIDAEIATPATIRHCMRIVKGITEKLSAGQSSVITGDQPVYTLGKQMQWMYLSEFENVMWMMGPLQIEMAFMAVIGDWLTGPGWDTIFVKSSINTAGRAQSFLWGNKDKRSRYAHQVSLAALIKLAQDSYTTQSDGTQSLEDWLSEICEISVNARYWLTVIKLETLLFLFVLSIRDANFDLFLQSLEEIVIWMFSLDHFNYARWMAVFICDLKKRVAEKDDLYEKFKAGFFMVKKSKRRFSNIGFDHAHEQNNKIVKTDGGAIGILDSPAVLLKWAVAGPEISRILGTIDEENGEDDVIYITIMRIQTTLKRNLGMTRRNSITHSVNLEIHSRSMRMVCQIL